MNTLMLIKHIETRRVAARYFKSEKEATHWWQHFPTSEEWEIVYLKERKNPNGHRYELICNSPLYSKYILCFSKKEALYLKNKIEEINKHYILHIKRIY